MLTNTFCHIPTIGTRTEGRIWASGVRNWSAFRDSAAPQSGEALRGRPAAVPMSPKRAGVVRANLDESARRLEAGDSGWFYDRLPANEHWRLFTSFRDDVAYLDIETTGLGTPRDHVTTIALYDGHSVFTYVHGRNSASPSTLRSGEDTSLRSTSCAAASQSRGMGDFVRDIRRFKLLVTFNGKQFDVPFLRDYLGVSVDRPHIDLRFVLASVGLSGSLKKCEHAIGLSRGDLEGVDGYFAVILWQEYVRRGNATALETLLAYNVEDVVNLETLMVHAYNLKLRETPFAETHTLSVPSRPEVTFQADAATVSRIRRAYHLP